MNTGRQATDTASRTQMSNASTDAGTTKPLLPATMPDKPRQPRMLKVLLPTTLPTAR